MMVKDLKARYPLEFVSWQEMKRRVFNPRPHQVGSYAGVTMCPEWGSFARFMRDMGPRPTPKHTLDRRDNAKGYEPANCRWATRLEQVHNRRASSSGDPNFVLDLDLDAIEFNGKTQSLKAWADECGLPRHVLYQRLTRYYWTPAEAISTPRGRRPNGKTDYFRASRAKFKKTKKKPWGS